VSALLELERVSKRFRHGARQVEVLREVSLQVHERELIAVWGPAGSGRSTLLRIVAGIEAPDDGWVRFRGRDLRLGVGALGGGVAYCQYSFRGVEGMSVFDEVIAAQLALGLRASHARDRAVAALERSGAWECAPRRPAELDRGEAVRVSIARALLQNPSLLVIDEPTTRVEPLERDRVLELLRSLGGEGIAVLMSVDKGASLFAADRALSLSDGALRGDAVPELAQVVHLPLLASG